MKTTSEKKETKPKEAKTPTLTSTLTSLLSDPKQNKRSNKMNKMKTTSEKKETKPKAAKTPTVTSLYGQFLSDPKLNENENENETFEDVSKRIASEICSYIVDTSSESMDNCKQDDSCHEDVLIERYNNYLANMEKMEKHNDEFTEKMRDFNTHTKKEAFNSFLLGANIVLFVGLIAKLFT